MDEKIRRNRKIGEKKQKRKELKIGVEDRVEEMGNISNLNRCVKSSLQIHETNSNTFLIHINHLSPNY